MPSDKDNEIMELRFVAHSKKNTIKLLNMAIKCILFNLVSFNGTVKL